MKSLVHFLSYHNAVPIALGVIFLGAGATFAATNPEAIYSSEEEVVSIDNTYIANKDLSSYTPTAVIREVTEDTEYYFVAYTFTTIDLQDAVWRDVSKDELMKVSKADLGPYRDLGVYVTEQLKQKIDRELGYLTEVQGFERQQVTQKTIATAYSGLVGQMLNDKTEVLPGYVPVVVAPSDSIAGGGGGQGVSGSAAAGASGGSALLSLQVLGNNPARIPVGTPYIDLGVVLLDPTNSNLGYYTFVDDVEMPVPQIDTSTSTVYRIEYRATDPNGVKLVARRIVLVGDVQDPGGEISVAGSIAPASAPVAPSEEETTSTSTPPVIEPTPTSTPESTPEPAPEEETTSTSTPPVVEPTPTSTPPETDPPPEAAPPATPPDTATTTSTSTPE